VVAYLIVYGKDPSDRLAAYAFSDKKTARDASLPASRLVPRVPPYGNAGGCAYVVETTDDVQFGNALILALFNGLSPRQQHVDRFESNAGARGRRLTLLSVVATLPPQLEGRDKFDAEMIAHGEFVVAAWRGFPKMYDKKEAKSLDEARRIALELYEDRPVMIYAVHGGRQVHVENFNPMESKVMPRGKRNDGAPRSVRGTLQVGEFKPVRAWSSLHAILVAAAPGDKTMDQIAVAANVRTDQASHRLRHVIAQNHGIGHAKDPDTGVVTLRLPAGKTLDDAVKASAAEAAE
jgi:hypothetical protein